MLLSTLLTVAGYNIIQDLGIVRGSTVRARNFGRDFIANLRNLVGGELGEYTQLQAHAREEALQRMIQDAKRLGADAILGIGFSTSTITQGASEIFVYGTAVKLTPK
ncbi:MAG: YbjQ family protein [Candidatus Saccharibacteria bacterium]|nr:YbjQ family protein [Candidatus Saccharibacteria bacterium]MCY4010521.1 YbjQ family protein [Candidatus Saccharibacteria bacterium]MCY4088696.1 YbjQ family protein [Candidatus Saccharibacteria bacterium]